MKKLIPAIVLLLVSAMLLTTSGYAWFSMNKTVSATGMTLTSTAPANLLIANSENDADKHVDADWSSKVAAAEAYSGKLFPASTIDGLTFHAVQDAQTIGANNIGGVSVDGKTLFKKDVDVTALAINDNNGDALKTGYWAQYRLDFKTTGSTALTVYLKSIDVSGIETLGSATGLNTFPSDTNYYTDSACTTKATGDVAAETKYYLMNPISDCVRVALINDADNDGIVDERETVIGYYAVDNTTTVAPITSVTETENNAERFGTTATDTKSALDYVTGTNAEAFTVAANGAVNSVIVRVWIEGQHEDCINAVAGQNFSVGLTFETTATN